MISKHTKNLFLNIMINGFLTDYKLVNLNIGIQIFIHFPMQLLSL